MTGTQKKKKDLLFLYNIFMEKFANFNLIAFYGTLLGIIREKDFIENDDDLDFLLEANEKNDFISFLDENNIIYKKLFLNDKVELIQCSFDDIGPIDVYFYYDHEEYILVPWDGNLLFEKKDIFPLKKIVFHNKECNIPNQSDILLRKIYGEKWKIPMDKKSYVWEKITKIKKKKSHINL